ncbi:MAG: DUF1016 N-terminal domain-containing protein [Opitutaceae bacterium]
MGQRAGWGEAVVERLAADLRAAFPDIRGFSISNLWRMRRLFTALNAPNFLAQAVREMAGAIPWGHHVEMPA